MNMLVSNTVTQNQSKSLFSLFFTNFSELLRGFRISKGALPISKLNLNILELYLLEEHIIV